MDDDKAVAEPTPATELEWECLYDKLIVRRDPPKTQFGSIAAPDQAVEDQNIGTVLKTGQGRWVDGLLLPLTIQPGMRVIFSKLAGHELMGGSRDVILLREDEILAYAIEPSSEPS